MKKKGILYVIATTVIFALSGCHYPYYGNYHHHHRSYRDGGHHHYWDKDRSHYGDRPHYRQWDRRYNWRK